MQQLGIVFQTSRHLQNHPICGKLSYRASDHHRAIDGHESALSAGNPLDEVEGQNLRRKLIDPRLGAAGRGRVANGQGVSIEVLAAIEDGLSGDEFLHKQEYRVAGGAVHRPVTSRDRRSVGGRRPSLRQICVRWEPSTAATPLKWAPAADPNHWIFLFVFHWTGIARGLVAASTSGVDRLLGQIIAERYHIKEVLGEGGMGRVYLAEHVRMGRRSAVKVLSSGLALSAEAITRFNR
ncbi:MAG TPA: hypothetical protein VH277_06015, partial [Gemmatimonadaceae bacterium]|nr:hypothetical protein [Gemmatimonadaceae bacterium]